ncbi:MAG: hypothetical protein IKF18_05295 [Erysipelotrichaceae bacterium]|nr:hypothetical protein [Erysipelotrichaceae bacterium]MBR3168079.1 hypothetical protein [Erysipelotrichaceae bacterium]
MSEKKTTKKKKLSKAAIVLILGLLIIMIPLGVFGGVLLHSWITNNKPVVGDRFVNDLEPAITNENMTAIETKIKSISGVEKAEVIMTTAQMRVNIDTADNLSQEQIENISQQAYQVVNSVTPVGTYFTSTNEKKMYDLAINTYNYIKEDDESMIYVLLTKNSKMERAETQVVSKPVNEELAYELTHVGETPETTEATEETEEEE